jgi:hypothetical protein
MVGRKEPKGNRRGLWALRGWGKRSREMGTIRRGHW